MKLRRTPQPVVPVAAGERVLASSTAADGTVLAGTRDAFYAAVPDKEVWRLPWEQVEAADWDSETDTFRLSEVGSWGVQRREVVVSGLEDPGKLLSLVRERVTASVVLQRHVAVTKRRGLRIIARRPPHGDHAVQWVFEYDEGVDPEDPAVAEAARAALAQAQQDVGLR